MLEETPCVPTADSIERPAYRFYQSFVSAPLELPITNPFTLANASSMGLKSGE